MVVTIHTQGGVELSILTGCYTEPTKHILEKYLPQALNAHHVRLDAPKGTISLHDDSNVRPTVQETLVGRDRAILIEGQLRQLYPHEFNLAETTAMSSKVAAQN